VKRDDINKSEKEVSLTRCVTGDLVLDGGLPGHVSGGDVEVRRGAEGALSSLETLGPPCLGCLENGRSDRGIGANNSLGRSLGGDLLGVGHCVWGGEVEEVSR
jgi:hypothetical protein